MSAMGVEKVEMKELLIRSDYISLHAPLTKETENAFGFEEFRSMQKTAWIINTSRGAIIREDDLVTALEQKLIAGAALDVLVQEPPNPNHPLLRRDNVIVTPHTGAMSLEARVDVQTKGAEEAVRVLKGERPRYLVNLEVLAKSRKMKNHPK
jgi:D-3-phosphoglycerate dehydrogenase